MFGVIDTSTEWLRLAGKKPDAIQTVMCGSTQVVGWKDAHRLEIMKRGITLFDCGYCMTASLPAIGARDAEGLYFAIWVAYAEEHIDTCPFTKLVYEQREKHRGIPQDKLMSEAYVYGWVVMKLLSEGVRLAIEKEGIENLSGHTIRDGLASLEDFDMEGAMPPVTMSDVKPWYASGLIMYEVQEGKHHPVSEWIEFPGYYKMLHLYK